MIGNPKKIIIKIKILYRIIIVIKIYSLWGAVAEPERSDRNPVNPIIPKIPVQTVDDAGHAGGAKLMQLYSTI